MKLFETALENFRFLGMEWDEKSQKFLISLGKMFVSEFCCVVCFVTMLLFVIKDAESFDEYTEALFMCSTAVMCTVIYIFLYIKLDVLSEFIRTSKIELSESKLIVIPITFQATHGQNVHQIHFIKLNK